MRGVSVVFFQSTDELPQSSSNPNNPNDSCSAKKVFEAPHDFVQIKKCPMHELPAPPDCSNNNNKKTKTADHLRAVLVLTAKWEQSGFVGLTQGGRGGAPQVQSLKPQGGGGGVQGERQIRARQTDQRRRDRGEGGAGGKPGFPFQPASCFSAVIPQSGWGRAGASTHF